MGRLREYAGTFTGFERDARRYLLVTLVAGAACLIPSVGATGIDPMLTRRGE